MPTIHYTKRTKKQEITVFSVFSFLQRIKQKTNVHDMILALKSLQISHVLDTVLFRVNGKSLQWTKQTKWTKWTKIII